MTQQALPIQNHSCVVMEEQLLKNEQDYFHDEGCRPQEMQGNDPGKISCQNNLSAETAHDSVSVDEITKNSSSDAMPLSLSILAVHVEDNAQRSIPVHATSNVHKMPA